MTHVKSAKQFLKNSEKAKWHDQSLWFLREKRDKAANTIPEWEYLRNIADQIKAHTLSHLDEYLLTFEKNATNNGIQIHWANNAEEHNEIVHSILKKDQISKVVKSKSMLTEECHLNSYLESKGIEVVDTDLGERIIQLRNEPPSHIVVPAIHLKKEEVADTFHKTIGSEKNNSDPTYLTRFAREHLREKFLKAEAGITGANFLLADEGAVVVCTNEGNADIGTALPPIHIVSAGIEKIIPGLKDLSIFIRLLARSATGQPITTYTSHFKGPRAQQTMHVILVDNGRSKILGEPTFRKSLQCIRCGACLNTCPVYRSSGGHSYHHVIPGPIGSVLAPHKIENLSNDLPFASSLCGSCTNVCPVKIDLHHQLLEWRKEILENRQDYVSKKILMKIGAYVLNRPKLLMFTTKCIRFIPHVFINNRLNPWCNKRTMPKIPRKSFKELYKKRER